MTTSSKKLGEKIKKLRKMHHITQSELVGDKITRNMLSSIESGVANPSLQTLYYIADRLSVSVSYLLSEEDDLLFFQKKDIISRIYKAYEAKSYKVCIDMINSLSDKDDELYYLLASSHLELAKAHLEKGALVSSEKNLRKSEEYAEKTRLDTHSIEAQISMYLAISKNVQSPLLEFDTPKYISSLGRSVEYEFYKYLTLDFSYSFENPIFSMHMEAKRLIQDRSYQEAIKRLTTASEILKNDGYHAFVIFGIYTDLEHCYKQLYDYEKAYLYSSKRMTLLEAFKG